MNKLKSNNVVVIYHDKCADGIMSAATVLQYCKALHHFNMLQDIEGAVTYEQYDNVTTTTQVSEVDGVLTVSLQDSDLTIKFVKGVYTTRYDADTLQQKYNVDVTDAHVLIVDFSTSIADLESLAQKARWCTTLDHHETSIIRFSDYEPLDNCEIILSEGNTHAGCELTFNYLFDGMDAPNCVNLVGSRDRWCLTDNNKAFHQAFHQNTGNGLNDITSHLYNVLFSYEKLIAVEQWVTNGGLIEGVTQAANQQIKAETDLIENLISLGNVRLDVHNANVASKLSSFMRTDMNVHKNVAFFNAERKITSDLLNQHVTNTGDAFAVSYEDCGTMRTWSLRSIGDKCNVAEIAAVFGGGGHKNAAGFTSPITVSPYDLDMFSTLILKFEAAANIGEQAVNYVYDEVARNGLRPTTLAYLATRYEYTGDK